jgi:tripartite-type tricarboxylate transporter receptor subunit TctC
MLPWPMRVTAAAFGAAWLVGTCVSGGAAEEAYYRGKRLTLLVNGAAGGPTDVEARLLARHIGRHIDGQPATLVQNMDGAGGLVGTNYLGEVAPKDGTVMGYLVAAAWTYATDPEKFRLDFKSYEFFAYQPGTTVYYVRADVPPGIKVAADIVKAEGLVAGGLAADNPKDLLIRLTLDMLGVPFKYVTGYRSNQSARLALEKSEINLFAESPPGYRSVVEPGLVRGGVVTPLFYDPGYNGESLSTPKQVEGLKLPPFQELYQSIKGAGPAGQLWDVYLATLSINSAMQRLLALPPGAPPSAVAALRAAMLRLNADPAFAEEAAKTIGFVPEYVAGPDTKRQVGRALTVTPAVRAFVADYIRSARK